MLCIPNIGAAGHVVGLKFRDLTPGTKTKYNQPTHQEARLFNLQALRRAQEVGYVYITEGEFDAMIVEQAGYPCIGAPGADSFGSNTKYRYRLFDGLTVFVCKDNDPSGDKMAALLEKELPDVQILSPAPAKDANELWLSLEEDGEEFDLWLNPQQ